jgi:hypothetical protein
MVRRPVNFFGMALALGADLLPHVAHRFFIAAEIRLRAAALRVRRFLLGAMAAVSDLGGRPRRWAGRERLSNAAMARSRRLRSPLSSVTIFLMSNGFPFFLGAEDYSSTGDLWPWTARFRGGG